ncbi:MAG TPA: hypothetical protein VFD69_12985 [Vicinamibacterales bacterium]|nr:hypothetical protein [Vicinamibacterales bacterium]
MRRQTKHLLVSALVVSAGLAGAVTLAAQGASRISRGAEIAPVPLNMNGLNPALVREGSYIVNAQGGCNDCHTVPSYADGGNPFFGQPEVINAPCYLAGGAAFGPFVSRNLTVVPQFRTLEQFTDSMRNGTDHRNDATPILQVMPWPVYGKMSDRELAAIYEFLKAIPVINPRPDFCTAPAF